MENLYQSHYIKEFKEIEPLFNKAFILLNSHDLNDSCENYLFSFETKKNYRIDTEYSFKALDVSHYEQSIELFNKIIHINPNHALSHELRGIAHGRLEDYINSETDFCKAIDLGLCHCKVYRNLGYSRSKQKKFKSAIQDYSKSIALNPNYIQAYYDRANSKIELNLLEDSLEDLDRVLDLDTTFSRAYYKRSIVLYDLDYLVEALEDINKALELGYKTKSIHHLRGFLYYTLGNYQEAIRDFNLCIRTNQHNQHTFFYRGFSKLALGFFEDAIIDLDQNILLDPFFSDAYYYRGFCYQSIENLSSAFQDYQKSYELTPDVKREKYDAKVLKNIKESRLKNVYTFLKNYIDDYPVNDLVYSISANAKRDNRQYDLAIEHYNSAISINPNNPDYYFGRAFCKFKRPTYNRNDFNNILEDFNKAIGLKNDVAEYYLERGNFNACCEKPKNAIKDFDFAIKLNSGYGLAYYYRAKAKETMGKFYDAIVDYTKCIELNPKDAFAYVGRGNAKYNVAGEFDDYWSESAYQDENIATQIDFRMHEFVNLNFKMRLKSADAATESNKVKNDQKLGQVNEIVDILKSEEQNVSNDDVSAIQNLSDDDITNAIIQGEKMNVDDARQEFLDSLDDICS
jgi:tetratricopeptide (TPR) repeat protein